MSTIYHPSETELMEMALSGLNKGGHYPLPQRLPERGGGTTTAGGPHKDKERRVRSLRTCHRPAHDDRARKENQEPPAKLVV